MDIKKILVGVFGGSTSEAPILDLAARLAEKENAQLLAFTCLEQGTTAQVADRVGTYTELDQSGSQKVRIQRQNQEIAHVRAWLEAQANRLRERGIAIETQVDVGAPGPLICSVAEQTGADLIVIGRSKRTSTLADCFLGSVSNHVVHRAPCSVLLVHGKS